jgi:hypothetical protein
MVGTTVGEWTTSPDAAQPRRKFCHAARRAAISKAQQLLRNDAGGADEGDIRKLS